MAQNIFDFWQFNNMSRMQNPLPTAPKTRAPATLNFWAPMSWTTNFQTDIAPKVTVPWQQTTSSTPNFFTQNVKPQATPSLKIPWVEQANAQWPDIIQQYLDDENEDYDNRQQIFKMIENWEDTDFIKNSIVNTIWYKWQQPTQEQPWFIWWVKESITNRLSNIWEWILRPQERPETISKNPVIASLQPLWSAIWQVGQVAGAVWDVGFEVLKWLWRGVNYLSWWTIWQALEWWAKKLWNSLTPETQQTAVNAIQQWWEIYSQFKKENPYIADTLEWSANIASLLPIGKAWQVWVKAGGKVIKKAWQEALKWAEKLWQWVTATTEYWTKLLTWLNRETQQTIKNSPELFKQVKKWILTPENVTDDVKTNIEKRLIDLRETWKWYQEVKKSDVLFPKTEIQWIIDNKLTKEWLSKNLIELPIDDRNAIKQAQWYLDELKTENLTAKETVELKAKLRSLVTYDKWVSLEWERVVKWIIKDLDNNLKEKIPWYAELDKVYWPEREFLNKVQKDILNKDWTLKDNAISTIRNLTWKWKEMKIERIEKIMPWITEKVKALKAYEDLQNALEWKTASYTRWILTWWVWVTSWFLPWIATFAITHPWITAKVLESYWIAKQSINTLLNKLKNKAILTKTEQESVKSAFKTPVKEVEKEILSPNIKPNATPLWVPKKINETWREVLKPKTLKSKLQNSPTFQKLWDKIDEYAEKTGARKSLFWWEWALKAPVSNLEKAKNFEKSWKNADDIWKETWWEKWTDWKWKFEIDDSKAKLKEWYWMQDLHNWEKIKLNEILEHDDLYKQYPNLKNLDVIYDSKKIGASFVPKKQEIIIWKDVLYNYDKKLKSTLLHEIQHNIQEIENFAKGWTPRWISSIESKIDIQDKAKIELNKLTNSKEFKKLWDDFDTWKITYKQMSDNPLNKKYERLLEDSMIDENIVYKRLAWETEARNIQTRLLKTPQERKILRPAKTEDVLREKQIIKMEWWKAMSLPVKWEKVWINEVIKYKTFDSFIQNIKELPTTLLRDENNLSKTIEKWVYNLNRTRKNVTNYWEDTPQWTFDNFIKDIKQNGIKNPIKIDIWKDWKIIIWDWSHRLLAAEELWFKNVPVEIRGNAKKSEILKKIYEESNKPKLITPKEKVWITPKKLEPLYEEARKYNTFDEFKKSQWEQLYHWTKSNFNEFDLSKIPENEQWNYWRWIYLTPNEDFAKIYGKWKEQKIVNSFLDKNANIVDWDTKMSNQYIKQLKNEIKNKYNVDDSIINHIFSIPPKPINLYKRLQDILEIWPKEVSDIYSNSWIHGVKVYKNWKIHEISIFNDKKIKTESQLKQIYEQAKKSN